eukprot:5371501-Alexandrium_andersonii.AAC.1
MAATAIAVGHVELLESARDESGGTGPGTEGAASSSSAGPEPRSEIGGSLEPLRLIDCFGEVVTPVGPDGAAP